MQHFTSTRGGGVFSDFNQVILNPSAPNHGLWAPVKLPKIDFSTLLDSNYQSLSRKIFQALDIEIEDSILQEALQQYDFFDDSKNPAPLTKIDSSLSIQELYHGSSRAFKDMALAPFGSLFSNIAKKYNKKYLILTATSGDTGPATLNSFANLDNIEVVCIYPKGGTSQIQELQMTTQNSKNLNIFGINGNFDDAQSILKALIHKDSFKKALKQKGISLSVANSVNFGRIIFQIVYHIWGYLQYIKQEKLSFGERVKIIVPSGNFGNALGAFYARQMGLPLEKITIASNPNNILTEFIQTGKYDLRNKKLLLTYSPAMDILKSSNIERVLFSLFGSQRTNELMQDLEHKHYYELTSEELCLLQENFEADFCDDHQCLNTIKDFYQNKILIDPHTANAIHVYTKLKSKHNIICSTAQWCKFAPTIYLAINNKKVSDKEAIDFILKDTQTTLPSNILELFNKPQNHQKILDIKEVEDTILKII
ncbi:MULTISPECIES: threonine synthase [unclassified Helicobacter]|uniref:threonine synthase n=1 Tax=unclassified Helicobacter TaxID=2593540 RepID=UPI000CF13AA7|nr:MULTISPECIES: threonine synthase [unclassified Helicobacter]